METVLSYFQSNWIYQYIRSIERRIEAIEYMLAEDEEF